MTRVVKKQDERRQELLDIGIRLFLTGGAQNVTVQDVVRQAQVATGLFYYYFKTKEDFIDQAVERYVMEYVDQLNKIIQDAAMPIRNRLDLLLTQICVRYEQIYGVIDDSFVHTPQHLFLERMMVRNLSPSVARLVSEGKEEGLFRVDEPNIVALYLIGGITGVLQRSVDLANDGMKREMTSMVYRTLNMEA